MSIKLKEFKERFKASLRLYNYEIFVSGDQDKKLSEHVFSVSLDLDRWSVGAFKAGDRVVPYFQGLKEDPVTFSMVFMDSYDGYVSNFFTKYYADFYLEDDGLIDVKKLQQNLLNVNVYQLGNQDERVIQYEYKKCLFVEQTKIDFAHPSIDNLMLSFTVYARTFKRILLGGTIPGPIIPGRL